VDWRVWPVGASLAAAAALVLWFAGGGERRVEARVPGPDLEAEMAGRDKVKRNPGTLIPGLAEPSAYSGVWSQFRGLDSSGVVAGSGPLLRTWPSDGLQVLWKVDVGEGHAGAAIRKGRVYIIDYDREKLEDAIRCLSLADGREIWRYTYYVKVKRNHGMSRTVVAAADDFAVAMGPLCHVTSLDASSGRLLWKMDLVKEFGTTVPPWYAGQCPLIDGDNVILAPGADPLMMAVEGKSGKVLWRTPNPGGWGMTHSSVAPMDFQGVRMYIYCTTRGVVGVSALDGRVLWTKPDWKISIATVPSPVVVPPDRVFLSAGYGAGCAMVRLKRSGDDIVAEELWRREPAVFGSAQHTPVLYEGYLYGIAPNGELVCLDLDGSRRWSSGSGKTFGLGPYMIADGMILVLNDQAISLHAVEASPAGFREIASAKVLTGHDAWAPMALADGRLILRDLTQMVCLKIGAEP